MLINTVLYRTNESKLVLRNTTDSTYDLIGHTMFVSQGDSDRWYSSY